MTPQIQTPVPHEQTGTRKSRRTEIVELIRLGWSYSQIKERTGASTDTIAAVKKAMGLIDPEKAAKLEEQRAKVAELLKQGVTQAEARRLTGAAKGTIGKIAGRGLFPSPTANRTTCTRKPGCECVWHRAEAERERRLAAKRKGFNQGGRG